MGLDRAEESADDADGGAGGDTSSVEDTGADTVLPVRWNLDAELSVQDGALQGAESELKVRLLDDEGLIVCTAVSSLALVSEGDSPPEGLVVSWSLQPGVWDGDCGELLPSSFMSGQVLAIGELHPEAAALLDNMSGLGDGAEESLNGAYFAESSTLDPLYVYGVAGLESAYLGEGLPAESTPLEDGLWVLRPVYSFPL